MAVGDDQGKTLILERAVGFNRSTQRAQREQSERSQNDLRTLEMGLTAHRMGDWLRVASQAQVLAPSRSWRASVNFTAGFRLVSRVGRTLGVQILMRNRSENRVFSTGQFSVFIARHA